MDILQILKIIFSLLTVATGLFFLLKPRATTQFTGLEMPGPRGLTEMRALGGLFIGLGLAPLLLGAPAAYRMLGISYGTLAAVRAAAMVFDRSVEQSNIINLVFEVVCGVVLVV